MKPIIVRELTKERSLVGKKLNIEGTVRQPCDKSYYVSDVELIAPGVLMGLTKYGQTRIKTLKSCWVDVQLLEWNHFYRR
jgi:hypothetical protein